MVLQFPQPTDLADGRVGQLVLEASGGGDSLTRRGRAMYVSYIMRRTQIYLTEEQGRLLESRSKATGSTVSQLIRTAVDSVYSRRRAMSRAQRVRLEQSAAGSWKAFAETGEEYVERIRGSGRLARLHGVK